MIIDAITGGACRDGAIVISNRADARAVRARDAGSIDVDESAIHADRGRYDRAIADVLRERRSTVCLAGFQRGGRRPAPGHSPAFLMSTGRCCRLPGSLDAQRALAYLRASRGDRASGDAELDSDRHLHQPCRS